MRRGGQKEHSPSPLLRTPGREATWMLSVSLSLAPSLFRKPVSRVYSSQARLPFPYISILARETSMDQLLGGGAGERDMLFARQMRALIKFKLQFCTHTT